MRLVVLFALLAVLAAGCGARSAQPFTAKGTIPCLKDKQFTVSTRPADLGFIATFASNGGVRATSQTGNVVTIAFTKDEASVPGTERAFRRSAPAALRPHIGDVMSANRNAVMVWTTTPAADDAKKVNGCLAS